MMVFDDLQVLPQFSSFLNAFQSTPKSIIPWSEAGDNSLAQMFLLYEFERGGREAYKKYLDNLDSLPSSFQYKPSVLNRIKSYFLL